ncbi:hypothetical protein D1007_12827 [Hordeum vulgare]|nr:hypothetical protein D1007_12827 [Hordeum vulgare]
MDRWEDELKRQKSSSGTRIRCVVDNVGEVFYIGKVVEVVEEIHKGGEKKTETANGDQERRRASEEKEESSGDAPVPSPPVRPGRKRRQRTATHQHAIRPGRCR